MQNPGQPPKFSIALYAGGVFVKRQRIKNGTTFYFYCVPDRDVYLVAEVDMTEIQTFSMGSIAKPPQINYQDIYVNWSATKNAIEQRNEVISARNSYERTKSNQKLFDKAMDGLRNRETDAALKLLEELIAKDPDDFVALAELGSLYCDAGRFEKAEPLFTRSTELKPEFVRSWFGLGRARLGLKRPADAITALSEALKLEPDSADINHFLGEAYLQNKQGTLAIQHFRRAIEISPADKADLHLRIAWLYNAAGAKNLAAEEYKLLLQAKPDHPDRQKMLDYIAANSTN
jgi:predicted Zn-dependent protease